MSYAPVYPIQQVCPGCMQNSRSFSLLLLSLPRRISKKNFFKIYREEYINPCPSFCFKTIKTLYGLERERKARYKLSSTILILSVLRSRIWNSRPQTWTWIRPSLMYPCRACKRKKKRKEKEKEEGVAIKRVTRVARAETRSTPRAVNLWKGEK